MGKTKIKTLEAEAGHLIRHISHFYKVGHSNYTRATQWAQVCYYGEAFIKAIDNFLQEEKIVAVLVAEKDSARRGQEKQKNPDERVTNELPPF